MADISIREAFRQPTHDEEINELKERIADLEMVVASLIPLRPNAYDPGLEKKRVSAAERIDLRINH